VPSIKEALILINAMHTIFINDDESGLHHYYKACLEALAPYDSLRVTTLIKTLGRIMHRLTLSAKSCENSSVIAITNRKRDFSAWEQILYGEFDRRRNKEF
jgi:thiamine phosphate synthase YjbQ (UPF0047 family)